MDLSSSTHTLKMMEDADQVLAKVLPVSDRMLWSLSPRCAAVASFLLFREWPQTTTIQLLWEMLICFLYAINPL